MIGRLYCWLGLHAPEMHIIGDGPEYYMHCACGKFYYQSLGELMSREVNDNGLALLRQFEQGPGGGPALVAYKCPAGKWTIGYGHTGPEVCDLFAIDKAAAEALLRHDIWHASEAVERHVTVPLFDNQFAALACFVFNIGDKAFADSTLLRVLNAGKHSQVPDQLARWNKVHGVPCLGLTRRRNAEIALWEKS